MMDEDTHSNLEAEDSNPRWPGQMALITAAHPLESHVKLQVRSWENWGQLLPKRAHF